MRRRRKERLEQYESASFRDLQARLATNVRVWRQRRGWSQEEAAGESGMSTRLFQRIEGEETNVTLATLARLTDGFKVDVGEFFRKR